MTPLAGDLCLDIRLEGLSLALNESLAAIDQRNTRNMIGWLREVRNQAGDVLGLLEGGQ